MESLESQTPVVDNQQETLAKPVKPTRAQRPWVWVLLSLLLLSGGIGLWRLLNSGNEPPSEASAQGLSSRPVETIAIAQGEAVRRITLLGQIEASETATVRTQTNGLVQRVLVQSGDRVTPGTTIAILDDADQQLAVAVAQARLAQERSGLARLEIGTRLEIVAQRQAELRSAQAREREAQDNLRRNSELVTEGALSRRTLVEAKAAADAANGESLQSKAALAEVTAGPTREEIDAQRASVAAATAAVNQARLSLQRTRITALSNGVVQTREVSTGDLVESNDPIVTLVNGRQLDVFLELPEELGGSIAPGLPVTLATRSLPNWRGRATLTGVVPSANAASRRQMVRVRLENPPQELLPGMAIQGELQLRTNSLSFVVPRDALTRRGEQWLIYSVVEGKAKQFEVELIADMGEKMAISNKQLTVGQPVVVRGSDGLSDGATVQVTEPDTNTQTSN